MDIATLAVKIGVTGIDKTVNGLNTTRKVLGDVTSTSLEAKAGILGVLYATQQLVSASNLAGMGLVQFANRTGISTDYLQRFQAMARASGISADEMASNIENVQKAMAQLALGNAPMGLQALSNIVTFDRSRSREIPYVMAKLREYAQKTRNTPDIANQVLSSFGLSGNAIGMLRTSQFDMSKVAGASMYSAKETTALAKMQAGWAELGNSIEKSIGHLNVRFGPSLLKDLTQLTNQILRMVSAFAALAEQLHVLSGIGKVFQGWTQLFQVGNELARDKNRPSIGALLDTAFRGSVVDNLQGLANSRASGNQTKNVNVSTHVTVHGSVDAVDVAQQIGEHVNKMINGAMRQSPQAGQTGGQ